MAAYGAGPGALQVAPEGSAGTRLRVALVVPGGVDASGERRVIPVLLALIERLVRRHDVRVFALGQYAEPREYRLLGARVTNLGRPARFADLPGRTLWWRRRALARALDRESCDVVGERARLAGDGGRRTARRARGREPRGRRARRPAGGAVQGAAIAPRAVAGGRRHEARDRGHLRQRPHGAPGRGARAPARRRAARRPAARRGPRERRTDRGRGYLGVPSPAVRRQPQPREGPLHAAGCAASRRGRRAEGDPRRGGRG